MKIYIVQGETGEYSDRIEWVVCAFKSEEDARECVEQLSVLARLLKIAVADYKSDYDRVRETDEFLALEEKDPECRLDYGGMSDCRLDYDGISYYMSETELRE